MTATEEVASAVDPKEKRKAMKGKKRHGKGREVTDPVTHLPVTIHDMTEQDLKNAPENQPAPGSGDQRSLTGPGGADKAKSQLDREARELQEGYDGMQSLFPAPYFGDAKREVVETVRAALTVGFGVISSLSVLWLLVISFMESTSWILPLHSSLVTLLAALGAAGTTYCVPEYIAKKIDGIYENTTWDAMKDQDLSTDISGEEMPESVSWLNSLLSPPSGLLSTRISLRPWSTPSRMSCRHRCPKSSVWSAWMILARQRGFQDTGRQMAANRRSCPVC